MFDRGNPGTRNNPLLSPPPGRSIRRFVSCLFTASLTVLPTACSWFGEEPAKPVATQTGTPAPPAPARQAPSSQDWSPGTTLADQRLERIYNQQQDILRQIQERPNDFPQAERDRILDNLLSQYQAFTFDNPDFVYGYILYGKLLRQVGDREAANVAFAKANQLDPEIAVVKQQIGNYLAEEGNLILAIPYFMSAIDLEPYDAIYHYQLGELLYRARDSLIEADGMTRRMIDMEMLEAFSNAARLDADNRIFLKRYAEAFFDVEEPDWVSASNIWRYLDQTAHNEAERDIIRIQRARVLIAMDQLAEAREILSQIDRPSLEDARQQLLLQAQSYENP